MVNSGALELSTGDEIRLSPGNHSELVKAIIEEFAPLFVPSGVLVYVGDTGDKWGYFDEESLAKLGVVVDGHSKMPDVVLNCPKRDWLLLVESVTSHGPVDGNATRRCRSYSPLQHRALCTSRRSLHGQLWRATCARSLGKRKCGVQMRQHT